MTRDDKKFWLGSILAILGVAMLFVAMFIDPKGEISGSVLGAVGELFVLAGSLLGLDSYFDFKLKRYLKKNDDGNTV
ncbi:MAG: hypothetical protein IJR26_08340 [Bacteroidales bacterium]|nr:hypothetical protein [Bacteroidales bacterium]